MESNYYEILGIRQSASEEEIKSAYKMLAKKYHPDMHPGNEFYEEHFKKVNAAYQTLSDKSKRQRYDLRLQYLSEKKYKPTSNTEISKTASPQRRNTIKRPAPKSPPEYSKKQVTKYISIIVVSLAIFITGALFFLRYMNHYTAEERLKAAKKYEQQGQPLFAIEYYTEALSYNDKLPEAYIGRAGIRASFLKDYQGGINDYASAIKYSVNPDYTLYYKKAKLNGRLKQYNEMVTDLDSAIRKNPDFDSLYFYKAEVNNFYLSKPAEAVNDYSKVISLNTNFKDALFGRAIAYQNSGNYSNSIEDFSALIKSTPGEGSFYYYRGYSKYNLKDTSGACIDWITSELLRFEGARETIEKYCYTKQKEN